MTSSLRVHASVSLWVGRGDSEDLPSGVEHRLSRVDGVEEASVREVTDVRPTFTDIRVDARVALTVTVPDPEAVDGRLQDGFGVTGVDAVTVEGSA